MGNKNFSSTWPSYTKEEANAVQKVLLSNKVNYWTGEECMLFEREYADWVGCKYGIAVANGTVALELALRAIDLTEGDEIIVTPRSFIASASCVVSVGGVPVFADVDISSGNLTANSIEKVITSKTKAIICVHLAGWPCDMEPILELAKEYDIRVIEDCAQAHGAMYKGKSVGSLGDIGCWSFCQDKIMTTGGEGGMITTNNSEFWNKMWSYKDHGKSFAEVYKEDHPKGFRWVHNSFGTNWRMTEIQAAIGRIQLKKMSDWNILRRKNLERIWKVASDLPGISIPKSCCFSCKSNCTNDEKCLHAAYKCYIYVEGGKILRDSLMNKLVSIGVPCFQGSCSEIYLEKAFIRSPFKPAKRLENARRLGDISLMFPCHPTISEKEIELTCASLRTSVIEMMSG